MRVTIEMIKGKPVRFQHFDEQRAVVNIMRNGVGLRFARIKSAGRMDMNVPLEMLPLAAGRDAWMREIEFKCEECNHRHPAREMECNLCPDCYEKAGEENARLDRGEAA